MPVTYVSVKNYPLNLAFNRMNTSTSSIKRIALIKSDYSKDSHINAVRLALQKYAIEEVESLSDADLVVSIGGDGTFLSTAARVGNTGTPILGINAGHLGFLADVSPSEIEEAMAMVAEGAYTIEERALVQVTTEGEELEGYPYALNEVAVLKHDNSSVIQIETYINGDLLNTYKADGLIIATPTGSTGYSLSAGGPIVASDCKCFCISAVAPHSLSVRPFILRDSAEIILKIHSRSGEYMLALDGRNSRFNATTSIRIKRAPFATHVMKISHKQLFDTLRSKMNWGENTL